MIEDLGEHEQAVALCDELLAGNPELPRLDRGSEGEVYYLKAKAVFYLDDLEGALFLTRRAMKTAGEVPIYRAFDGQILFELGALRRGAPLARDRRRDRPRVGPRALPPGARARAARRRRGRRARVRDGQRARPASSTRCRCASTTSFFRRAVSEAIDNLPRSIREYVEDVPVLVEDFPSRRAAGRRERLAADPRHLHRDAAHRGRAVGAADRRDARDPVQAQPREDLPRSATS